MPDLEIGTLVTHPNKPEWGLGKVVGVDSRAVHVIWRDHPQPVATPILRSVIVLSRSSDQHDPILDNLPPVTESNGKFIAPERRHTVAEAIEIFCSVYPGGFYGAEYLERERNYKIDAHQFFKRTLGGHKFRRLLDGNPPLLAQSLQQCIGKVNLLSPFESAALHDALKDISRATTFLRSLREVLESDGIEEGIVERYFRSLSDLPANRSKVATWPVATIIPFLAQPERFQFLKPTVTQEAADALGFNLNYLAEPNWLTYSSLLRMGEVYKTQLASLRPRDLIDIQSFFWVSGG